MRDAQKLRLAGARSLRPCRGPSPRDGTPGGLTPSPRQDRALHGVDNRMRADGRRYARAAVGAAPGEGRPIVGATCHPECVQALPGTETRILDADQKGSPAEEPTRATLRFDASIMAGEARNNSPASLPSVDEFEQAELIIHLKATLLNLCDTNLLARNRPVHNACILSLCHLTEGEHAPQDPKIPIAWRHEKSNVLQGLTL